MGCWSLLFDLAKSQYAVSVTYMQVDLFLFLFSYFSGIFFPWKK